MSDRSGEGDAQHEEPRPAPDRDPEEGYDEWLGILREIAVSVLVVLLIAGVLFGISGVWPPLVAVESNSMEPQIMTGDLVFIVEPDRFADEHAIDGTGVVPADRGEAVDYEAFDRPGDVIIFAPNGDTSSTPIIHRAHFWVEEGENWHDRADPRLIDGAESCDALANCPAPNEGFITHGDNNGFYDQAQNSHKPVKSEWVNARASTRIPWLGHIRLVLDDLFAFALPAVGLAVLPNF